jgi:ATP-dependent DNA helicase RecG
MSMLIAIDNGYQACLMAPTEILANQHYETIRKMVEGIGIKVSLLTGSSKRSRRKTIDESLLDNSLNILIGTHALIEENVRFSNSIGLGLPRERGYGKRALILRMFLL